MSLTKKEKIKCPKCGHEAKFTVWQSINTATDKDMKEAVGNGSAFVFDCPECGSKTAINYSFLFHQPENKFMVYCAVKNEDAEKMYKLFTENPSELTKDETLQISESEYVYRIVRSADALREKVNILENGLDDRIIEIIKGVYVSRITNGKNKIGKIRNIMFSTDNIGRYILQVLTENSSEPVYYEVSKDTYEKVYDAYKDKIPPMKNEYIVDLNRAAEILQNEAKN